jgi:hypothetical protein
MPAVRGSRISQHQYRPPARGSPCAAAETETTSTSTPTTGTDAQAGPHVECIATGMDVQCYVEGYLENGTTPPPGTAATSSNGSSSSAAAAAAAAAAAPASPSPQPPAAADLPAKEEPAWLSGLPPMAAQAVSTALLVSPFFFWGTSMVAMKVGPGA